MKHTGINNAKLGLFVLAGLFFLILLLYMIGRNQNLFGSTFTVRARFQNVQGLVPGNNVRYAGIQVGTVKKVNIINDTLVEVIMIVDTRMQQFIHNNAIASVGTDGLMGNKLVNIIPAGKPAPLVGEGDILQGRKSVSTEEMLQTLDKTTNDVAVIAENLKTTVIRFNNSSALWKLLNDNTLPESIRHSAANIQLATAKAAGFTNDLQIVISDIRKGKGSIGALITDTSFAVNLKEALVNINSASEHTNQLTTQINEMIAGLKKDMAAGKGPVNALLRDSAIVIKLNKSLDNIEKGTDGFNQNMEALKHNFLFRGYFRKLEKQQQKQNGQPVATQ